MSSLKMDNFIYILSPRYCKVLYIYILVREKKKRKLVDFHASNYVRLCK